MSAERITQLLRCTAWQGNFTALQKTGPLRIVFLSELSADGALLYFHRLMGDGPTEIMGLDEACEFTPRALKLETSPAPNSADGTISVFQCAGSETEESELETKINRPAIASVKNVRISISSDENTLEIIAPIAGVDATYKLTRQRIPAKAKAALRSWLQGP